MREWGKVYTQFWASETIRSMSEDGRWLSCYGITSPHSNIAGVYRLPDGYVCDDLQWASERVAKGFEELFRKGFANRCGTTKWVWIRKYFEWNPLENPNQVKAAKKIALSIPDECAWKPEFMRVCGPMLGIEWSAPAPRIETLSEPFPNQEQEQEQEQQSESEQESFRLGADAPPSGRARKPAKPKSSEHEKPRTRATWEAYKAAYTERYSEPPVGNAKVYSQLSQLLSRIPADEAPSVAAFYVRSNNQFYVAKGHAVGMLLADAEKLRTEWKTGQQRTHTEARLGDRAQSTFNAFAPLIEEARRKEQASRHHGFADRDYGRAGDVIPE